MSLKVVAVGVPIVIIIAALVLRSRVDKEQPDRGHCAPDPCQNGGVCTNARHGYSCACPGIYTGRQCENKRDDCVGNNCANQGTCEQLPQGGYTCACTDGFTGEHCTDAVCPTHDTSLMSAENSDAQNLLMRNDCQESIELYWVGFDGSVSHIDDFQPKETRQISSFVGHYVFARASGSAAQVLIDNRCEFQIQPMDKEDIVTITAR